MKTNSTITQSLVIEIFNKSITSFAILKHSKNVLKIHSLILLFLVCSINFGMGQTPQYYNYNTDGIMGGNSYPFNQPNGEKIQLLYLPGDFSSPSSAPSGDITALSFRINSRYPLGPYTYSNFVIQLGQSNITSFTAGSFYSGSLTTVYNRTSVVLSGTAGGWMTISLDNPFAYDPTKSLIVSIEQCSAPGASGYSMCFTELSGTRRLWSSNSSCPISYYGSEGWTYHLGINITPIPTLTTNSISNLSTNTATCGGNITDDHGFAVNARGVVWSTSTAPTLSSNELGHTTDGDGIGAFTSNISGLSIGTTYYIRAYATNSKGTGYGNEIVIKTLPNPASNLTFSNVTQTSMDVNWTNGNGDKRILLGRMQYRIPSSPLTNGVTYSGANSSYSSASTVSGAKLLYNGIGSSVSISNLTRYQLVYFKVIEYNEPTAGNTWYQQTETSSNPRSRWTLRRDGMLEEDLTIDADFAYPNPAKDNITVTLDVFEQGTIKADLISIEGKVISSLYNSELPFGTHELKFNLQDVLSGTYFLLISKGNEAISYPLQVVK